MVQYEREVNGRLKMTVEQDYRDFYRAESGGNMTIDGRTDRSVESPYGVVTYKHDTRKYTDFVRGLNDVHVIQFAAPFNNVEKSISSRPNILASTLSTIYDKVGWAQQLFPSETGMLMRTGQLSTLLMDKTNFKSTVQQPVALYDSEEALIKTQAQAQYHANKDGTVPEIIGNHEGSLQHAKLTEGLYSELIQKTIQKEFAGLGVTKPVPKAKAQFTGAMFTDVAIGGLSLTGSGGLVGAYEDYSIGFENPTIVNWFKEFRETGLREDRFVKEDAVSAKGVKVTGNLSIYEERNKQLTELVEILKVINPEGKNKGLANVVIASPSMDWNEFSRDASTKDQEQKKAVGQYIKLMQEVTKYGGNGVLIMDPSRINIPNNERRRLLRQWYIGSSKRGKDIHTNIQTIQLAKQTGLTEEQKALLQAKGLLEKAQTGIHTFNAGNFRPSGNYSINVEVGVDLLKADPATVKGTEWIEAQIALTHNAFLPRRDIAQEGIAGSMLREFYTPTFKDSQEGGFTQEGLLPNMPLSMPNSFFRYFKPGTRTHIYSDRYRALTGEYATGIQGDVLRQLDAKLSDPGPGYRLNYLLQQRDLYEPGKGVIGTAAAAVGRFIDTATGFYTLQTIQARESGQLRGSLRKLYESRQRDPYEETEARGFFENLLVKTAGTISATTTAMAAYFGVTHAYTMARAQVEQVGVDYVLESIAKGHTEGVKGLFIKQLLDPSHQELVVQASKLYNADTTRMVIKNTGDALEAYFDLATRSSLQALQSKHSNLTNDFINAIVPVDEQTGGIKATDIGDKAKSVIEQVKAEAEGALKGENAASLAHDITRRLDEKISAQLAIAPDSVTPSYVRGLVTDIYKELGVDRDSGTIELGRPTDSISATRVTQPAGFSNLAGVRRLDTSNLQHMFIPLLDEMVLNKDSQAYKTAKQNLLRLSKASPILMYRQTANNIAASSDLKIYNYGYERMRQLAEVFDDLATQLPANPLMWIKPIRQAFMGSPTTATTTQQTLEQGEVTSMRHTFKELIGPGFTGLINLQGQITRELGQSFRTGIGGQLEVNFDLMRRSRIVQADAAELGKLIAESKGVSDLLQTTDADKFSRFIAGQTEYEGLLSKHRKDYEQMLTAEDSNSAYAGLRKALLGVGTVMIVDRLFDAFVLRPQGIDFFDSIKSDIFGTRSPALEGSEEDSRWQALYGTEYSNALPSIVKYPAAAAGFFVGGHLIPSYEIGENAVYAAARKKFAQDGINELSAFKTAIKSTATEGVEAVTQVGLRSQLVKTKFGTGGALLGASAALIGSQLAVNFAAATAKTIVQGTDHLVSGGRWRDSESGLDVDPVKGSAAAALANIVQYSIQRQDALYKKGYAVTADDKTDAYLLNMASQGLTESSRKPSQMFYPFATQIASPFFQFASVAKVDPGKNVISLDAGLQLFPLLGAGVMMPVPITPKVQYTAPLSNRMIANYLRQYQEGIIVDAVPSTMEQDQEIEAFVNMQNISKASSMLLGGGVNLSFDSKPLVYLAMMGAGSDFAQRGMEKYLAFKKVQDGLEATKQSSLYKELRHYETLFHLGKVGFDTLDKVSRAAYSLSAIMPNYLAKAGSAMLGGSGSTMHQLGSVSRKAAPYLLAFGLLGASFRFNDKALESELPNYSKLQQLFKKKQYEGLTQEMLRADAINLVQVSIGTGILGTAIASSGAFESVRSFKGTYDLVQQLNDTGGQTTYIQRQQHKLFGMWLEHLAEQQTVNLPILTPEGEFKELEKVRVATADEALDVYKSIDDNIAKGNLLYRRHLNEAARQIDLPLIRTMPTRLGMVSRRVAPIMVGAMVTAQLLSMTEGFRDSPWMSLLKNITGTGSREYSPEQRAMLSRLGINESKYQPETAGDVFNNVRDYLVSAAFLPFGGNAFGVYQDNPNPFSPILGPLGVSMGSADEARIYSQSQSVAADISGSLYLMPAMTDGLGEALNIGPLLSYAKRLEGRPGAASLAKALIRGAGLRTRAAKFKGGPSQRDMQAASSPEMQMELTRRYDRLRNLTWQTAGEHMMDIVGEFQRAGRVISDYRDNKIDGVNINVTRPADVMIFDTLGKMSFQPILQDGRNIKPKKTTERDLLKFVRNMTAQGAGFGEGARLEASEDPSDILYSRSQDRGGLPVLSYFGGLFTYAFNSFYDKDQDALIAGSSNLVGAGLMAGAAIVLGASFIGTTASTVIQLAGSLAALSDYGTLADAKTNVGDLKRSLKTKLRRSSFAIYEPAASAADNNQRIIRPWGKNYGRTLTLNQTITQEVLDQINQNLTGAATFGGYSAGHDLETLVTQRFGETASDLVENMSLQSAGPIESTVTAHVDFLNKKLDDYLTVNVDGKRISIAQVFNPSLEEGVSGISSGASAQIAEVLASGKNPQVQRYEIEHILLDEFHRNLEVITAEKSFDDFGELTGQYQSARTQFGKTQKATEQAAQAKAAGAVNEAVELYDPSIGFLRSKIQQKGYSGLIAEGAGGALRGAGELINLKAYYEILSYTAAMSTTNNFERRRASQAAAQNTIQAFGMIIPMQYALGLIQRNPTLAIGAAVGTAVVGGLALQNKQFGKAVGRFFNPIFSALDKYAYRPAVQGLAGTYEALAQFTPIPQLLSPIASLFDPIFSNIRRSVSQDPSLSMLTNFFVPEGVEDFYQRNAILKTRMTPWGDSYELYSAKEVGQFYETKMTSRRRRGRVASAGIDDDLLHPFMLGRSADIQSISLFEERYLGGDGRIMDQFRPERMLSNTLMLAIQRRQGMIDQHVEGAYLRRPYHKDNVHQDFAVLNALGRYSYAQTGSLFEAPVNQMARGIGPMMQLYVQFAERVAPYAPITKRAITGAALGYLAGAQFSHFGRNEEERRRNAAVGGSIGAGVGGVLTTAVSPFVEEKAQYHLLNLRKNPLLKGISEKLVSFGAGISSALKAIAGGIGKGLNAAFPYIGFGGLVGAATYSSYDSAVNWIDGEDSAKKHPLYNPWMRFGVSASVGAATTALGFAGTRFSTTNAQYPLAKAIGGSLSVGAKGAGLFAQFGALSFLTNFMLTNNLVGAAPRGMVRAVYDRLGLGRPEDFDNVYDTTSKAVSIGVAPLAMFIASTGHETHIKNLRKTLGYGKVAAGTNVKLEQMAQATREAAEIKELLAKLNGSSVIVEPDPNVQVQLLLNSSAGLSDDLVNNLSTAQKQDIPDLIQKGIQAKEARLSIVNELIDAQVQRGFVHNTLRSTRGILKTFGNISTLGIGYALRGVLKAWRSPALLTVPAFGATLGLLSNETFSSDGDSATGFSRTMSALGGAYVSLAALGMIQAKGSSDVSLPKPLQRIADWFINIFDPNVPDAPQSKTATYIKDKFHKLGNWLINLGKDTRSTQFPHGATFPEVGKNLKQPFITLRSAALPVAAFSIDALNLYTSVKQINNLKYGRSQAEFQKAYSSYQSVITTTSFTALMGMFARNASFASFVSSTLQLAGISEKAGYRRGDYEFASLEDISDTSRKELAKAKERDTLTALGVGSLSLVGAGVSYVRANPESVISKAIARRMPFVQSAQMAKAGAAADLLALPIVNTVMTGYEIQRIASDKNQRFGYGNMAANNMAQTRADLLGIGLFALGASLLARRPSASWGRTVLKSAPGIATIGAALSKDAFVDRFQYSYTDRFQKAGITNAYAQNLIARKAAKSTSDNYGLVLGGSILLTAGLMVLTRGKGPSKQFLATLPALATAGTAFANYEITVNSEINKRKDYRANQGLSSEELTKYEAWQKSDTMFPDEWKDSDQYRNYSLYRKGQEQRWAKWNANYYSSTGIRKGKGLGTQKLLSPWSVPKDVLRENAYMQQTQAMKPFEPNPIAVGLAVAGGGVVGGMALSAIRHAAGPNFKPPDILAKGESFFDAKHRAGSTGQIFGNLAIAAYGVWRFVSNNKDIRDKANQTISGNNAGEIQAIRASADIVLKHDETVQDAFLSQIPTGGNNWVGKSVRQFLGFAIGKSIFEGLVNPWTRANEEKRVADTIRKARKQGINVDSALLQKALKAQAKAQADPMIGTSAGALQFFATGTNNPLALAEGGANSVMTALGITSALSAAKGMRRFENVMLEKSASVTGAIPKSGNGKIRTASVSGAKEEEESNFVEDYVTNPFIYSHALPRIAGSAGVASANTWLLRKTWTWTKNAIQRTITPPGDPQKIPVAIDPNPDPNKPGGSPLDPPSPPTAPDGTATLDPIVDPKAKQVVANNFSSQAPDSQVVIESVINPDPKSSTTTQPVSTQSTVKPLSTEPVKPVAPVQVTTNKFKPTISTISADVSSNVNQLPVGAFLHDPPALVITAQSQSEAAHNAVKRSSTVQGHRLSMLAAALRSKLNALARGEDPDEVEHRYNHKLEGIEIMTAYAESKIKEIQTAESSAKKAHLTDTFSFLADLPDLSNEEVNTLTPLESQKLATRRRKALPKLQRTLSTYKFLGQQIATQGYYDLDADWVTDISTANAEVRTHLAHVGSKLMGELDTIKAQLVEVESRLSNNTNLTPREVSRLQGKSSRLKSKQVEITALLENIIQKTSSIPQANSGGNALTYVIDSIKQATGYADVNVEAIEINGSIKFRFTTVGSANPLSSKLGTGGKRTSLAQRRRRGKGPQTRAEYDDLRSTLQSQSASKPAGTLDGSRGNKDATDSINNTFLGTFEESKQQALLTAETFVSSLSNDELSDFIEDMRASAEELRSKGLGSLSADQVNSYGLYRGNLQAAQSDQLRRQQLKPKSEVVGVFKHVRNSVLLDTRNYVLTLTDSELDDFIVRTENEARTLLNSFGGDLKQANSTLAAEYGMVVGRLRVAKAGKQSRLEEAGLPRLTSEPESISPTLTSSSESAGPSKLESRKPRFGQIDPSLKPSISTFKKQALTVGRFLLTTQSDEHLANSLNRLNQDISRIQLKGFGNLYPDTASRYGHLLGERQAILLEQKRRKQANQQVIETVTPAPEVTPKPLEQPAPPQPQASKLTSLINEYDVDVDGGFVKPASLPTSAERQMLSQQRADRVRRGQAKGIDIQMMLMDMVYGKAKESVTGVISKAKEISQPFVSKVGQAARGTANQAWDGWSIFDRFQGVDARFGNQGIGGSAGFWARFGQNAKYELSGKGIVEGGFGIGRNAKTGKVGIQGKSGAMALAGMGLQLADDILTLDWSRKNFAKSLGTVAKNQASSLVAGVAFGLVTAGLGALALSSVPALAALGVVGSAALMAYGIYSLADQGFKVGGKAWEKFVLKRKRTAEEQKAYEQQSQVLSLGFGVGTFVYAGYNQIRSLQSARGAAKAATQSTAKSIVQSVQVNNFATSGIKSTTIPVASSNLPTFKPGMGYVPPAGTSQGVINQVMPTAGPVTSTAAVPTTVRSAVDVIDDVKPSAPVGRMVGRSGVIVRNAGKAVKVASMMYSVYQIGTGLYQAFTGKTEQTKDQGRRQVVREIGGLIGMRVGAKVGGTIGRAGGAAVTANPTGAIVGDVAGQTVGGYIGYQGGSNIAERVYDNAMKMMYGKMNQRQRQEVVTKEVKRRSAGSQYNLEVVQAKEQKVAKQMERPRAWWLAEEEEEIPWWKRLLQTIGKGVEALGNFLTRTKNAALEAADALTNWATGGVPLSSEALVSGNLTAANSRGTAIIQAAQMLGVNPLDLATIVEFESDGKPHIRGGAGGNYTGLIQFGPNERKKYGYHSKMTFEEQMLGPVVSYFKDRFKSAGMSTEGASLEDLYTTVLAGNPKANRGSRDAFGTSPRSGVRKMTAPGADRDIALQKYFIVDGTLNAPTGFQVPSGASWASSMGVRDAKTLAELPQRTGGSRYGNRVHPVTGKHKLHAGEDYAAPTGTPLSSSTPAVVVFAGVQGGYGNTVILRHSNGTFTRSAHLSSVLVKAGDVVMPNQLYGKVGSTGLSTGPHLHFEEGTWDTKSNRFVPKPPTNLGRQSIKIGGTLTKTRSTPPTSPQDYFRQVTSIPVSQGQSQQIITRTQRKFTKVGGVTHYAYTNTSQKLVTIADSQAIGRQKQQLNSKAAEQVNKMLVDLKAATGVDLWILSGYRSVETQQQLWNRKKKEGKSDATIAKSLAIPGFSEHHTGDAFDISLQGQANLTAEQWASNPKLRKARAWLDKNQSKYHLETSFLPGNKENVVSEPWHLRYVGEGSEYARQVKANVTATQQTILNQQQTQQNTSYVNMPTRGARAYFPGMSTGPRGRIGAGSAHHVDIKLKRGVSFDVMVQALDAMATTYATQGLYIRVSNNGAIYNPKATHQQKLAFVKKGFDSHWRQDRNYWSMDYYIVPKGGSTSVAERGPARPIAVPLLPGTSVTYAKGGGYGLHAIIKDAKGNVVIKQGHGDTKGAIPTGVSLSAPSEVTPPGLPPISSLPVPPTTPQSSQQQLKQAYQPAGGFKQVKASYYGKGFHGKRTASGEIYNQNALTVAVPRDRRNKPIIPFGTILEVINPTNGKRVLVKVTDTGSFGDAKGGLGRGLDLSVAAAKALGTIQAGVANVQYRIVKPANNSKPTQSPTGPKLELPTIKPADTVPLVPTAPAAPSPKPKKKFSILDPSTWLRSEVPTNANPVAARTNSDEGVLIASAGVSDMGMPIVSTNKPFSSKQGLLSWNPNDIYTDSQAKPDPNSIYRRLPKPNAPQTASGTWGAPGHRPTPTGNYHDYGKRPPQRRGPVWGGPGSRPEQIGNYQDWEKVPQRDRATPSVLKVPGHRPEVWDILSPIGNIPGALHLLDKGKRKKDDFSILWEKRNLPTPPKPKQYPESIKDQIKVQIPGLLVAVVVGGAVVKGGLDADLAQFAQEAQAAVIGAATAAVQLVNQVKEEKANTTIALEHPATAAAVRPIHQRGQELRTTKRQVVAVADQQDNTVYVSQQVSVHAVQAQLANRDVKVPANPQVEAASQPRMMNTKAN